MARASLRNEALAAVRRWEAAGEGPQPPETITLPLWLVKDAASALSDAGSELGPLVLAVRATRERKAQIAERGERALLLAADLRREVKKVAR